MKKCIRIEQHYDDGSIQYLDGRDVYLWSLHIHSCIEHSKNVKEDVDFSGFNWKTIKSQMEKNKVNCPYCGCEIDLGVDWQYRVDIVCGKCGKGFRVVRDYNRQYSDEKDINWYPKIELFIEGE